MQNVDDMYAASPFWGKRRASLDFHEGELT
jgi:hypothetical protein